MSDKDFEIENGESTAQEENALRTADALDETNSEYFDAIDEQDLQKSNEEENTKSPDAALEESTDAIPLKFNNKDSDFDESNFEDNASDSDENAADSDENTTSSNEEPVKDADSDDAVPEDQNSLTADQKDEDESNEENISSGSTDASDSDNEINEDTSVQEELTTQNEPSNTEEDFNTYSEKLDAYESEHDTPSKKTYNPEKPRGIDGVFDFLELFIFSLAAVLLITTFFFRHSVVEGSSMEQTLFGGEHLIISDLFYTPERGDIIVCEDYTTALKKPIVKRVIAVAGDHIQITEDGRVTLNGERLDESEYVYVDFGASILKPEIDIIVPEGEVFVMGDHRNMSTDSRDIGTISEDSILGKVLLRFYPFDKFGRIE